MGKFPSHKTASNFRLGFLRAPSPSPPEIEKQLEMFKQILLSRRRVAYVLLMTPISYLSTPKAADTDRKV